jgi:hypothetical protein
MGAGLGVDAATRYPSSFPNNESGALFFGGTLMMSIWKSRISRKLSTVFYRTQ